MAERDGFDWDAARARIAELGRQLERGSGDARTIDRLLDDRAVRYRQIERSASRDGRAMIVFVRGQTTYALALESIAEIRITGRVTALPGVSPVIKGIVNVRGRITAVHDLACFGGAAAELPSSAWLLIGHGPMAGSALIADEVEDIRRLHQDAIRPVPLSLARKGPGFIGATEDGVVILDFPGLLASAEFFYA